MCNCKNELTDFQKYVLCEKGTEKAFTGEYWNNKEEGVYLCACCDNLLFESKYKFDSGTGWPSFYAKSGEIETKTDKSYGMIRQEVLCGECGGHLGHLFDDGPAPTYLRYCINSASLKFISKNN